MKRLLVLICALAVGPSLAATAVWVNIGPEGGEARSFASNLRTDTTFVLNPRSGIWRSVAGEPWILVFDAVVRRVTASRVAVDPQTSRVYVGTSAGLFRSDDQGATWQAMTSEAVVDVTALSDHLIISIPKSMLRSSDAGLSWTPIPSPPSDEETVPLVRFDPQTLDRVIAAVGESLYRSEGTSWKALLSKNIVTVAFGGATYAAGPSGVYDCDTECQQIGTDSAVDLAFWRGIIYAAISDGVLRYEPPWRRLNEGFPATTSLSLGATQSALLVGTTAGVYRSEDGIRWKRNSDGLTNVRITSVAAGGGVVVASTQGQSVMRRSGGIWTTGDSGLPGIPPSTPTVRKLATDGSTFYAAYLGNGLFRSTNQGTTWDDLSAVLRTREVFDVAAETGAVVAATLGGLIGSTDRGSTWRTLTAFPAPWAGSVAVRGGTIAAGFVTTALVSADSGSTWSSAELPATIRQMAIAGNHIYAVTDQGLFVRTDAGWIRAAFALVNAIVAGGTRLYVAAAGSGIYLTDNGDTWRQFPGSESLPPDITALAVDEAFLYAGTNGGSIFAAPLVAPRQRTVRH